MWDGLAYNDNLLKVMIDPATWIIAAIAVFGLRRWSVPRRVLAAFVVSLALAVFFILRPSGDWFHAYALPATAREVGATMIWTVIFLVVQRWFARRKSGAA